MLAIALAGCGGDDGPAAEPGPRAIGPVASCMRPSPVGEAPGGAGPEIHGRATGAQVWGLVFARRFPLVAGPHDVKVAWRMTGAGPLQLAAFDGRGRRVALAWGPEEHGGSTYHRPGAEWGSGYRFRRPGCYRLTLQRGAARGEVWVRVARGESGR